MIWKTLQNISSWQQFFTTMEPLRLEQRGKAFELLAELFLRIDPIYRTRLRYVWHEANLPSQVRHKLGLPTPDIGIDLVAESNSGDFWAIQCKYHHDPRKNLTKNELNSFIDVATRICRDKFQTLLVLSSAHGYSPNLQKYAPGIQYCLSSAFQALDEEFFRQARGLIRNQTPKPKRRIPRPHQERAVENAVQYFIEEGEDRGKLIHPCGTGKSLIGYWVAEALQSKTTLVALPSLHLVRQTLADWTRESLAGGGVIDWMVVCSEATIGESDDPAMRFQEVGVDVTTDVNRIAAFLRRRGKKPKVVFTTYQSGDVTARAAREAGRVFDLGIFDEAHRTVGKKGAIFSLLLDEANIRIRKRVFMTATERRYQGLSDTILSMEDSESYGETFDKMTFKEALERSKPILSDYRIVTMLVGKSEIQHLLDENLLVKPDRGRWDDDTEARTLAALVALRKVMTEHRAHHALTFHNSIAKAEAFKDSLQRFDRAVGGYSHADCFHVSSKVNTGERKTEIEKFKASKTAVITNAKCLTEGVDVPAIDAVLFADPKRSVVDIVQAAGRALRASEGKERGYIIVPVLVDENDPDATDKAFQDILMVLRAMASNDDRIIDYFRSINQGHRPSASESIIHFGVPDPIRISLDEFVKSIEQQVWHRLAKISWRPFEEGRRFARGLKLKSAVEWTEFAKSGGLPADIPASPRNVYNDKGWKGFGDWLGTGTIATYLKEYRPFEEARAFARSLGLQSVKEWRDFTKSGKLPEDIPATPDKTYRHKGWIGIGDWLGTGNVATYLKDYRSFEEAREFARGLYLQNGKEWMEFTRSGKLPEDIPTKPYRTYKDKGWKGIGDWLGTGTIANQLKEYRPFEEAREFVRSLGLKNQKDWNAFAKSGRLPADIPRYPSDTYKDKGWIGIGDWLGTGTVAPRLRRYRPFEHARDFARGLNLKNWKDWQEFAQSGSLPEDIPAKPDNTYNGKGWTSVGDWLGTGNVANYLKEYRPFEEARAFARSLDLQSVKEWVEFTKKGKLPADIPAYPSQTYRNKGWKGMGDWLGTGTVAPRLRRFRPFEHAREFARSLGLRSVKEWINLTKSGKLPADIPTNPQRQYKDMGWKTFGDWLGTGTIATKQRDYRPFNAAREFVRSLGLKSEREWKEFAKSGRLPSDIPATPYRTYKGKGWKGIRDWLGVP